MRLFFLPETGSTVKVKIFSVGLKPRYHLVNKTGIWGGLTLSLGIDYTNIDVSLIDKLNGETINYTGGSGTVTDSGISMSLSMFTITPEVMTNAKLLIFKPFLALGAVLNVSSKMDINGTITGNFTSSGVGTPAQGFLTLSGNESAQFAIPYARGGFALDLWVIDLTFQGQVALANDTFFGGGVGLRVHF
ncbi:MAG TPA: hypothetical protein ENI73_00100 [Spirochaetes bacterium]|nr:hypothetical protein [Spirochaetota bacterium]